MKVRPLYAVLALLLTGVFMVCWLVGGKHVVPPLNALGGPSAIESAEPVSGTKFDREPVIPAVPLVEESATSLDQAAVGKGPGLHVAPWFARLLVVDEDQQPVPDATVTIWRAKRSGRPGSLREGAPLIELRTDTFGRTVARLEHESLFVAAQKDGVGRSADVRLLTAYSAERETKVVIEAGIVLRGRVLRVDGLPAAGAKVITRVNGFSTAQRGGASNPEPVLAGADGRFEIPVQIHAGYRLYAEQGGVRTFSEELFVHGASPPEVLLSFPGGITISGQVVDPEGIPVAGAEVSGWREYHLNGSNQEIDGYERVRKDCGEDGRFSMSVRRHARYVLIANGGSLANSTATWVETTVARPHVRLQLALQEFAMIRGWVLRGGGSALPGIGVGARAEKGEARGSSAFPGRRDLFGLSTPSVSYKNGYFELAVHPDTTWTVAAVPFRDNRHLWIDRTGIVPGGSEIELRLSEAELAGCVVHGTVQRTDGEPLGQYEVVLVKYRDGKACSGGRIAAVIEEDGFTLPALALGHEYGLVVLSKEGDARHARYKGPVAPHEIGPFRTDTAELSFEFRLQPFAEVTVRVLDASGQPARRVRVGGQFQVASGPFMASRELDADGKVTLKRCVPGTELLTIYGTSSKLHEQKLSLSPGLNPEVVVRLPASGK